MSGEGLYGAGERGGEGFVGIAACFGLFRRANKTVHPVALEIVKDSRTELPTPNPPPFPRPAGRGKGASSGRVRCARVQTWLSVGIPVLEALRASRTPDLSSGFGICFLFPPPFCMRRGAEVQPDQGSRLFEPKASSSDTPAGPSTAGCPPQRQRRRDADSRVAFWYSPNFASRSERIPTA